MMIREAAKRLPAQGLKLRRTGTCMSLLALLVSIITLPVPAGQHPKQPTAEKKDPALLAEFEIPRGGRPIFLPVSVQNREYQFLLDTGISGCSYDTNFRNLLGEQIASEEAATAGGQKTFPLFAPPEAYLGKFDLRRGNVAVSCVDLKALRSGFGKDFGGIVGMGFLKHYVLRIDFDSGKVQFRSWDGRNHPEWGTAVPLFTGGQVEGEVPYVNANLAGIGSIKLVVDLGCAGTGGVGPEMFDKLKDTVGAAERVLEAKTVAAPGTDQEGTGWSRAVRISSLALGGSQHRSLVMWRGHVAAIGLGFLSRYIVTFDFPSMKMYLQKGRAFDRRDEHDMSGLDLARVQGRTFISMVDNESPAAAAGIKPEDVILKVSDQSASAMDIYDIRDLLKSGDGKEIKMAIKRGDEEKVVSFKLKKRI